MQNDLHVDLGAGLVPAPSGSGPRMVTIQCVRCGEDWTREHKGGTKPKFCLRCRPLARRETKAAWEAANPEKVAAAAQRYRDANRAKCNARTAAWYQDNREQKEAQRQRWRDANRDQVNEVERSRRARVRSADPGRAYMEKKRQHLRGLYGLEIGDYDAILARQNYGCAICFDPPEKPYSFHVDHDHDTGEVRGLLCPRCNPMLGLARDSAGVLMLAIEYLENTKGAI